MLLRSIRSRLLGLVLATVVPFLALIGGGLWNQLREDQAEAKERALSEGRLLAAQVDDHIGNLENLMVGLSRAVSTDAADREKNDALFRQVKAEQPDFISNILLFSLDGANIGTSFESDNKRFSASDRTYFRQVLAGQRLSVGEVIRAKLTGEWVVTVASPVEDQTGHLRAVLAVGTKLEHFQDALRTQRLPGGSVVRIVNQNGIVVAQSEDGPNWIGRDLSGFDQVTRTLVAKEASEVSVWSDDVQRITGSSTAHRVPWLVSVGLPTDIGFAAMVTRLKWSAAFCGISLSMAFAIAWILSGRIVGPLRQLERDALALAGGALSHRTTVEAPDEVGNLGAAFNHMAASLEHRQCEVQESKNTLSAVIDASPVAIACTGLDRRIILWNRAAEKLYGYTAEEVIGNQVQIVPQESKEESVEMYERALSGETVREREAKRKRKNGSLVDVKIAAAPMYGPDGSIRGVAWAHEDISKRKKTEEQIQRIAHYDQLTGLPNRLSLQKELGRLLAGDRCDRHISVALFDLDRFKDINDTLGHTIGDQLLIEVGQQFIEAKNQCNRPIQVFRLGGDEFVLIVPECGDPRVVGEIVDGVLTRLSKNFEIVGHAFQIGGSAGIAMAPNDGANVDELIANADLALYQAKSKGGRTSCFFLPALRARAQARRGLDLELARAHAENEFEIYFQPEVRLVDGAIVGAEALLRWRHPERGVIAPGAFIEALAANKIAPDVGRWIIHTACAQVSAWRTKGLLLSRIGINLFPPQFRGEGLVKDVGEILRETNLPAHTVEIEITEHSALDYEDAARALQQLHEMGVNIAFDDFGTGYASLSYLTRFPISRIKIDRSFIGRIADDANAAAIVRSLIVMAHNLGLEVIAEGVETDAQAAFLLGERCEEAQGFLYAKPLPATDFESYLRASQLAVTKRFARRTGLDRCLERHARPVRRRRNRIS